jgi:hypothetical protein
MILTPTITIDSNHTASFNKQVKEFHSELAYSQETHNGSGDLQGMSIDVKHIRTLQGNGMLVLISSNDGDPVVVARLIAAPVPQGAFPWSNKVVVMDRIRVHRDWIGEEYAPALYRWISERGYTVISDSHQTQTSMAVWRKLGSQGNVFTVNINDCTWRSYDPLKVEDWMLFGNNDMERYWGIRFMLPAR